MIIGSQGRERSKSSKRMSMKSPLMIKIKNNLSKQKPPLSNKNTINSNNKIIIPKISNMTNNRKEQTNSNKIFTSNNNSNSSNNLSTSNFKHKLIINSNQFNKLKQKLQSLSSPQSTPKQVITPTNQTNQINKNINYNSNNNIGNKINNNYTNKQNIKLLPSSQQKHNNRVKIKILQTQTNNNKFLQTQTKNNKFLQTQTNNNKSNKHLSSSTSSQSTTQKTITTTTNTLQSQQIQILKVQNQYFKKIYDQTLNQVSKLKNKLKQQKKVHDVEKQIYQNQINKLKRIIIDSQHQQVSHLIQNQQNGSVIVISLIQQNMNNSQQGELGLESDGEQDKQQQFIDNNGHISFNSNRNNK